MKSKRLCTTLLSTGLLLSLILTGCGQAAIYNEDDYLTAEQRAAKANGSQETSATTGEASEGFASDATIGICVPWEGTQNWVEAETMFKQQLEAEGFNVIIEQADQEIDKQKSQLSSMIDNGVSVIVIAPIDGTVLGDELEKAKKAGIYVIGYDRLIENTSGVDSVVQFGSVKTGVLQAEALLEGLAKNKGPGPYNIELFGGGPTDPNAPNFFSGALTVLEPKIADGTINIISGEKDFSICATENWDNSVAANRMDSLLAEYYADTEIHGILCPNDGIARAVITECEKAGQQVPVVSGLDAETETVKWVWEGKQYSTVAKPTESLVARTVDVIKSLQAGNGFPSTDVHTNNGVVDVPIYELPPVVVTKENAKEAFANDPERSALLK